DFSRIMEPTNSLVLEQSISHNTINTDECYSDDMISHEVRASISNKINGRAENGYQVIRLNHPNKIAQDLETMLYEEMLCDVIIICNGQSVKAHRVILASCSTYFKEIFSSIPLNFNPIVFLKNFTNEDLNDILEFVYKGQLVVPSHRLQSLIESAKSLGVVGLATLRLNHLDCDSIVEKNRVNNFEENKIGSIDSTQNDSEDIRTSAIMPIKPTAYSGKKRGRKRKITNHFSGRDEIITSAQSVVNERPKPGSSTSLEYKKKIFINSESEVDGTIKSEVNLNSTEGVLVRKSLNDHYPLKKQHFELKQDIVAESKSQSSSNVVSSSETESRKIVAKSIIQKEESCDSSNGNSCQNASFLINKQQPALITKRNLVEMNSSKASGSKITKTKLRSWSQQIMAKNLTSSSLLNFCDNKDQSHSIDQNNFAGTDEQSSLVRITTEIDSNRKSEPDSDKLTTRGRGRGRPKKLACVPRLAPLSNLKESNFVNDLRHLKDNLSGIMNSSSIKRGRGRPPLYQRDPSITSAILSKPGAYFSPDSSCIKVDLDGGYLDQTEIGLSQNVPSIANFYPQQNSQKL
ncbi:Protein jim lovell, partial [Sarcoptes scabiei]